jgi:4'-phosphopantetheinyl transferase
VRGPQHPRLALGALHVWRADLATVSEEVLDALSLDEQARAARFLSHAKGRLWARSRGVLRELLSRYLETEPGRIRITAGEYGKPALIDSGAQSVASPSTPEPSERTYFNLSHSRGLALYAFAETGPVGVDVEALGRRVSEVAIAQRALGSTVARELTAHDQVTRGRAFLQAWTRHEALVKCTGTGLGCRRVADCERRLWSVELEMGSGAVGAVAAAVIPRALLCCDWDNREQSLRPRPPPSSSSP